MCYSLIYNFFFLLILHLFTLNRVFTGSFQIGSTKLENTDYICNSSSDMHCHLHLKSMVKIIISKVQFFFFIRKETYQFGPIWSTLVYPVYFGPFDLLCSLQSNLVHFGPLWSNSIYFSLFGPHLSSSIYLVHSVHFGLIWSILAHFGPLGPIQYIYLRMEKDKFWLRVLSIIWVISIEIIG